MKVIPIDFIGGTEYVIFKKFFLKDTNGNAYKCESEYWMGGKTEEDDFNQLVIIDGTLRSFMTFDYAMSRLNEEYKNA